MDKAKIIPVIFLVIILLLAGVAMKFYNDSNKLTADNKKLATEKGNLIVERDDLRDRYNKLDRERQTFEEKIQTISAQLDSITKERDDWKKKSDDMSRERDALVEKLKEKQKVEAVQVQTLQQPTTVTSTPASEEYWADFVKVKAGLEIKVEDLNKQLADAKMKLAEFDKNNKELTLKIDQVSKEKERVEKDMEIKERTMNIMSRDLVSEREARKIAMEELAKLRNENVGYKRELVMLNKEKVKLQGNIKESIERRDVLEQKISGVENVMKGKSLELEELQKELTTTIKGGEGVVTRETTSVELPPIVVKSGSGPKGLRGEVLAVNPEEKFIVVNLGEASGVGPGNQLKVLRRNKEIGNVEIIETRKDISAADIKDLVPGVNIQEGDIVVTQ
jgi:chromosome segregation ATPase